MTADTEITDHEIREWARKTGREVGDKGRVGADLRGEYERVLAEAAAAPSPMPDGAAARGPESDSAAPAGARDETQPRRVRAPSRRQRATAWMRSGRPARKRHAARERIPVDKLIQRGWETASRILTPVNLPVARCLDWQAPTAAALAEEGVRGTIVDRVLQPVARIEDKLEIAAALMGPPVLVMALQLPGNQPVHEVEVTGPDGQKSMQRVPWPAGAMRQQVIMSALIECLDACVEAQEKLPAEVRARQQQREQRRKDLRELVQDVFFAPPPADPAAAAAEEEAMARAREKYRGA